MKIYTVGYEKMDIEDFCKELKKQKINFLADIRKNPISRKKGFSKKRLAENLKDHGIDYIHLPGLGVPTYWRKLAKAKMLSRTKMFSDYNEKILPKQKEDLQTLRDLMKKYNLTLMCYEIDASDCHRSYVAKKLRQMEKKKLSIIDLILKNYYSEKLKGYK